MEALEVAVATARRDARSPEAPPPPRALQPWLRMTGRLPERALATVRDVLDADEEFRARVLDAVDTTAMDRGAWLFLSRPEGWSEELAALDAAAEDSARERDAERRAAEAGRRVEHLEATLEELRAEVAGVRDELRRRSGELAAERRRTAELDERLGARSTEMDALEHRRAEAVRQLKAAEALAAERLERLRRLQPDGAAPAASRPPRDRPADDHVGDGPPTGPAGDSAPGGAVPTAEMRALQVGLAAAAEAVDSLSGLIPDLLRRVDALTAQGEGDPAPVSQAPPPPAPSGPARSGTRAGTGGERRVPTRLRRGLSTATVDGVAELLATPQMVVLVDGYNASMARWPRQDIAVQRDSLVALLDTVARRTGAEVHVVFDGVGERHRPAVTAPRGVRQHYTESDVEADDRILEFVGSLPVDRPVTVVSSDRRVVEGAVERGANVVSSEVLLGLGRR